jgi:D-3-phosphoglycerate dehydrogenase / 2-oxoglutarate reductase
MASVLVSDTLSDAGLHVLRSQAGLKVEYAPGLKEAELAAKIGGFDALVVRSGSKVTKKVIEAADKLRVIGRAGIGVDNVDVPAASKRGIVVMNTPTGNAVTTAEHALTLLMSLARKIPQATMSMKSGKWEKNKFQGRELAGKTLGVLGLGNIGRIVADRAQGLKMNVIAFDPVVTAERASQLGVTLVSLEEIWARADAITVHTPLNEQTRGVVDDAAIAKMKPGVLLVNCARGGIYDEAALERGIKSGRIGGVALDVFVEEPPGAHPLLAYDNVICTPHLGASTEEAQERVAVEIAEQVAQYLTTGTITNAVNVPNVSREAAPKLGPYLELAHKLGSFLAQVEEVCPTAIEVECSGEPADLGAKAVMCAGVAGVLARFLNAPINQVSAPHIAKDCGIVVRELIASPATRKQRYANEVGIRTSGDGGREVVVRGAIGVDNTPQVTQWGGYELAAQLGKDILVVLNENKPGVIGAIGTILGRRNLNVSSVQLGLNRRTNEALSLWNLDSPLSAEALAEIKGAPNVAKVIGLHLG